jgi:pimeloyl-ACP methyl ester carboxylesterase
VALFLRSVGMPAEQVNGMRQTPFWPNLEAIAPTLAYDHTVLLGKTASVPAEQVSGIVVPTLVMFGRSSHPSMQDTARVLTEAIPDAELRGLEGQSHDVNPAALAPVLREFFAS